MSEPIQESKQERDWRMYVDDMISFAEKILAYTDGLEQSQFEATGLTYDATLRNLELIGKAAPTSLPRRERSHHTSSGAKLFPCAIA